MDLLVINIWSLFSELHCRDNRTAKLLLGKSGACLSPCQNACFKSFQNRQKKKDVRKCIYLGCIMLLARKLWEGFVGKEVEISSCKKTGIQIYNFLKFCSLEIDVIFKWPSPLTEQHDRAFMTSSWNEHLSKGLKSDFFFSLLSDSLPVAFLMDLQYNIWRSKQNFNFLGAKVTSFSWYENEEQ